MYTCSINVHFIREIFKPLVEINMFSLESKIKKYNIYIMAFQRPAAKQLLSISKKLHYFYI